MKKNVSPRDQLYGFVKGDLTNELKKFRSGSTESSFLVSLGIERAIQLLEERFDYLKEERK